MLNRKVINHHKSVVSFPYIHLLSHYKAINIDKWNNDVNVSYQLYYKFTSRTTSLLHCYTVKYVIE